MKNKIILLLLIPLLFASCYEVKLELPTYIEKIYVKKFVNEVGEYNLEVDVTNTVIGEFLKDGRLQIVDKESEAHAVLEGVITKYEVQPIAWDYVKNIVTENRLKISVRIRFYDKVKNELLFEDYTQTGGYLSGEASFSVVASTPETEKDAKYRAALDLAKDIVSRVIEGWPEAESYQEQRSQSQ
ncbi:MAG: LptE family protein [Candidatus Hydrogenedentota bacterium]